MARKLLKTRRYKAGYEIRYELVSGEDAAGGPDFERRSAWTPDGHYIGSSMVAHRLVSKRGIKPELAKPNGRGGVCCVGFCEREQKWYGWSQRALFGFGIGDIAEEGDACTTSGWTDEYLAEHPEKSLAVPVGFVAETLVDARRMAVAFAEAIG